MTHKRLPIILVVEDEGEIAALFREWLTDSYIVRTARSGDEALEKVDEDVDVVLLDRRLPGMSGDEVLQRFRERGIDCRVAMISGVDIDVDVVDMEFDTYLVKPVTREDVRSVVKKLLTRTMYDNRIQRYLELVSRAEALEEGVATETLQESDEYQKLKSQQEDLRAELEYMINNLDDDYFTMSVWNFFESTDSRVSTDN